MNEKDWYYTLLNIFVNILITQCINGYSDFYETKFIL